MTSGDIIGLATLWAQACLDAPRWPSYSESHQIRIDQARERFVQAVAAMQAENEALRAACRTALMLKQLGGMLPGTHEVVQSVVDAVSKALEKEQKR